MFASRIWIWSFFQIQGESSSATLPYNSLLLRALPILPLQRDYDLVCVTMMKSVRMPVSAVLVHVTLFGLSFLSTTISAQQWDEMRKDADADAVCAKLLLEELKQYQVFAIVPLVVMLFNWMVTCCCGRCFSLRPCSAVMFYLLTGCINILMGAVLLTIAKPECPTDCRCNIFENLNVIYPAVVIAFGVLWLFKSCYYMRLYCKQKSHKTLATEPEASDLMLSDSSSSGNSLV
jgi:hypothetical protein